MTCGFINVNDAFACHVIDNRACLFISCLSRGLVAGCD